MEGLIILVVFSKIYSHDLDDSHLDYLPEPVLKEVQGWDGS